MKKLLIALGVSAAMVSGSALAAKLEWDTSGNAAALFVQPLSAEIEAGTCSYNFANASGETLSNIDITATEKEQQNELNKTKEGKQIKPVSFEFTDCPVIHTNKKVALSMYVLDTTDFTVKGSTEGLLTNLAVKYKEAGAAENANIQLLQEDGSTPVQFGKNNAVVKPLAESGTSDITFKFNARVYSPEGKATPGIVKGNAPFVVEYK